MSDGTKIEWTDATVNAINGCSVHSPGCTNCYAMRLAGTRLKHHESRSGLTIDTKAGPVWNGEVKLYEPALLQPLRWKRPRMIFWNAHGDTFHEKVPDEWIDRMFAVMALTPQHTHQVLTKRPDRMREYICKRKAEKPINVPLGDGTLEQHPFNNELKPPTNVWLGVSVEDQKRADERIPDLLATPAAVRWLSMEPLLGPVDLDQAWHGENALDSECWGECNWCRNGPDFPPLHNCQEGRQSEADYEKGRSGIDWIVLGGESGPGARPMHPDWARSVRDQCAAAGVPFHFKQWGDWAPCSDEVLGDMQHVHAFDDGVRVGRFGKKMAGRNLDGVEHNGVPA